mmetsp:Transcript_20731/g.42324  ORF Transcript_20731/g.42324 Transcript_20731/m.42324 type:complete len:84 (+) Transcript_20731:253-504(+)
MATAMLRIRSIPFDLSGKPAPAVAYAFAVVAIGRGEGAATLFAALVFEQGNVVQSDGGHTERFGNLRARISADEHGTAARLLY